MQSERNEDESLVRLKDALFERTWELMEKVGCSAFVIISEDGISSQYLGSQDFIREFQTTGLKQRPYDFYVQKYSTLRRHNTEMSSGLYGGRKGAVSMTTTPSDGSFMKVCETSVGMDTGSSQLTMVNEPRIEPLQNVNINFMGRGSSAGLTATSAYQMMATPPNEVFVAEQKQRGMCQVNENIPFEGQGRMALQDDRGAYPGDRVGHTVKEGRFCFPMVGDADLKEMEAMQKGKETSGLDSIGIPLSSTIDLPAREEVKIDQKEAKKTTFNVTDTDDHDGNHCDNIDDDDDDDDDNSSGVNDDDGSDDNMEDGEDEEEDIGDDNGDVSVNAKEEESDACEDVEESHTVTEEGEIKQTGTVALPTESFKSNQGSGGRRTRSAQKGSVNKNENDKSAKHDESRGRVKRTRKRQRDCSTSNKKEKVKKTLSHQKCTARNEEELAAWREKIKSILKDRNVGKPYVCEKCGFAFKKERNCEVHRVKGPCQIRKCRYCGVTLLYDEWHKHLVAEHVTKMVLYFCHLCGKEFIDRKQHWLHMNAHSGVSKYKCEICSMVFKTKDSLVKHKQEHREKTIQCPHCDRKFHWKEQLETHLNVHTKEKTYECKICGRSLLTDAGLRVHILNRHTVKQHICKHCNKEFRRNCELVEHMTTHEDNPTVYTCEACGKVFTIYPSFKHHVRFVHNNEGAQCDICGKEFRNRFRLQQHQYIHKLSKHFKCPLCGKEFSSKTNMQKHLLIHSDEKPWQCEFCGYRCKLKGNLTKHLRIHKNTNLLA